MEMAKELFTIPSYCPVCGSDTVIDGQFLFCRSKSCPVQLTGSVKVWVKRLGLLHWGDAIIESLTDPDNPAIGSVADLYRLDVDTISLHCSGMKMAKKCYETLQSSKSMTLDTMIASLNIQNLATSTASDIVSAGFDTVDKILSATPSELETIPNVGKITAKMIYDGLLEKTALINDLCSVLDIKSSSGPLSGMSFCITGSTSKPRKAIEKMIVDYGGTVKSSVGSATKYLVTNDPDSGSSKLKNAKKHGTIIIQESQLYFMMKLE